MARYHYSAISELTHQLKLSPTRLRLRQLDAAEHLIDLLEPDKSYPYELVCHHITGYRPKGPIPQKAMLGRSLIEDLVQLVEDLSGAAVLPISLMPMPFWSGEELAARLKVSTKTICRWRRRGLAGRKLRYADASVRMSFSERAVRRFIVRNQELVKRGAAFKQLSSSEKQKIVALARELLSERRMRLHELAQVISLRMGRAVETIRYTLRRYDQAHPEQPLFGSDKQPAVNAELQSVFDAVQAGQKVGDVARRFGKSAEAVRAIVREVRARRLKAREIRFIYSHEFESPSADHTILAAPDGSDEKPKRIRPPQDLPPYLQDLYREPLLTPQQERHMFRRYNYLKFKADRLRNGLDVLEATDEQLAGIEQVLGESEQVKNEILRANLRLVVSIARRHVGRSPHFFEVVSDGNLSLMRAVEKFDYARGFKFSTYASWAIMRNYARTIPEQIYQSRLITGADEALAATPARNESARDSVIEAARHLVQKGLGVLSQRERDIIVWHYGLDRESTPLTLDQIGRMFGVTKERVRQIERKAFGKLRVALDEGEAASAVSDP